MTRATKNRFRMAQGYIKKRRAKDFRDSDTQPSTARVWKLNTAPQILSLRCGHIEPRKWNPLTAIPRGNPQHVICDGVALRLDAGSVLQNQNHWSRRRLRRLRRLL